MHDERPTRRWSRRTVAAVILLVVTVGSLGADHAFNSGAGQRALVAQRPSTGARVVITPPPKNDSCARYPLLTGVKPDAGNTGVPAGISLTTRGDMTVTRAGTVVIGYWIKGTLTIAANNVTVEDNKIETPAAGYFGIIIKDRVVGTRIVGNELWGDDGGYDGIFAQHAGSAQAPTFICGNYMHNWENDVTCGPNMMVQANFITAMQNHQNDHDADGIENYYGGNTKFWGNNILAYGPDGHSTDGINSAINITATGVDINGVQIHGNWLGGGGGTIDLDQQGATTTNVSVTDNVFYRTPPATFGPTNFHGSGIVSAWTGNTWSDGASVREGSS